MTFRFIHTGDWHLAKPFGRFDAETAPLLREARMRIVDRIGPLARETGATAVLVAGDVFDRPMVGDDVLRRLAVRLEQFGDLAWHFLPGNHDPSVANGVWQRFARFADPAYVVIHHDASLHPITPGVELLTAPLRARSIAHDPTAWMTDRPRTPGCIRVGLAHGAVQGFGSRDEASVKIAPDRADRADLDYLALGDWHGVRQAGARAWYAGTPEPDQFPDNEPGYALSVAIAGPGAEPVIERHWLAQFRWQRRRLDGDVLAALAAVETEVAGFGAEAANLLLRLDVCGRAALADQLALRQRIEQLGARMLHLEADFAQLEVAASAVDTDMFSDPLLDAVGRRLASGAATDGGDGAVARHALLVLARLAQAQEGSG